MKNQAETFGKAMQDSFFKITDFPDTLRDSLESAKEALEVKRIGK